MIDETLRRGDRCKSIRETVEITEDQTDEWIYIIVRAPGGLGSLTGAVAPDGSDIDLRVGFDLRANRDPEDFNVEDYLVGDGDTQAVNLDGRFSAALVAVRANVECSVDVILFAHAHADTAHYTASTLVADETVSVTDTGVEIAALSDLAESPFSSVTIIFWGDHTDDVYLTDGTTRLPIPAEEAVDSGPYRIGPGQPTSLSTDTGEATDCTVTIVGVGGA